MDILCANKLYLRAEKCKFKETRIEYLGVIIAHNKVEMDPVKVAGVTDWPIPKTRKELQSFLSFTNFYHHFIDHFSDIARILFDLTKKDKVFVWGIAEEEAFVGMKKSIMTSPVLHLAADDQPFRVMSNGSRVA